MEAHIYETTLFTPSFYPTNVLFLAQFSCNLISISQPTKNLQCKLTFYDDKCDIQDLKSLKTIGVADEINGLYAIQMQAQLPRDSSTTIDH